MRSRLSVAFSNVSSDRVDLTTVACRSNPDMWFSDFAADIKDAKRACASCPVGLQCLELGMDQEYGIFGGLTPKQREILRKRRNANQYIRSEVS